MANGLSLAPFLLIHADSRYPTAPVYSSGFHGIFAVSLISTLINLIPKRLEPQVLQSYPKDSGRCVIKVWHPQNYWPQLGNILVLVMLPNSGHSGRPCSPVAVLSQDFGSGDHFTVADELHLNPILRNTQDHACI